MCKFIWSDPPPLDFLLTLHGLVTVLPDCLTLFCFVFCLTLRVYNLYNLIKKKIVTTCSKDTGDYTAQPFGADASDQTDSDFV